MAPNILFLTGAPESSSLNWDSNVLINVFTDPIARFLDVSKNTSTSTPLPTASSKAASWRDLPLTREHLPTGLSQNRAWQDEYQGDATFFIASGLSVLPDDDQTREGWQQSSDSQAASQAESLSHFYEHSFAVHEDIASSQIPSPSSRELSQPEDEITASFDNSGYSNFSASRENSQPFSQVQQARGPPTYGHLSDLEDIPNANYLNSIQPQTMTINVIVGIISISPPRIISTRRGAIVSLIEVIVGDETKSGFGINFWVSPNTTTTNNNPSAGQVLSTLRPQDIVLMRNVALSSFRGKVYGQSLRKELTKVDLLFRNRVDRRDSSGCYSARELAAGGHPQLVKAKRVREWVLRFVGGSTVRRVRKGGEVAYERDEDMPPTTQ